MKAYLYIYFFVVSFQGTFSFTRNGLGLSGRFVASYRLKDTRLRMTSEGNLQQERLDAVQNQDFESEEYDDDTCSVDGGEYQTLADELQETIDLSRETTSLESMEQHILVNTLTTTSSFGTLMDLQISDESLRSVFIGDITLIISIISAMSGIYSVLTFSMYVLHGKTALGLGKDELYGDFIKSTEKERDRGFQAFQLSLTLFTVQLVLLGVCKAPSNLQLPFLTALLAVGALIVKDWNSLTKKSIPIFTNKIPDEYR